MTDPNTQDAPKYHAFISYRHADNKEDERHWATWLHVALETYEVPSELVGTKNDRGEIIPARIYPIFRDEEELPADADLGGAITRALADTNILVVLCSPRAVQSTYVADEIDYFKRLGRSNRIIALIIDGEPNTSLDTAKQAAGFSSADECFPLPLQFEYDENGPTTTRAEPIAADLRITTDGVTSQGWTNPESYRAALKAEQTLNAEEIDERVNLYVKQHKLMLLKIVAGIIGMPLGELTRRDKAYQIAIERERTKKLRRWLIAVGLLAILAIATGVFAVVKQQEAVASQLKAEQRFLAQMEAEAERLSNDATKSLDANNSADAISALLKALPSDISKPEWPIKANTKAVLNRAVQMHREQAVFLGPNIEVKRIESVDSNNIVLISDKDVYLYSQQGEQIRHLGFEQTLHIGFNNDKTRLVAAGFIAREEATNDGFGGTSYESYFVAFHLDTSSGKTLHHIDQKMPSSGYRSFYINQTPPFSNDGEMYTAQLSEYSGNETHTYAVVINTRSGKQLRKHKLKGRLISARFSASNGLIVEYDSSPNSDSYNKSLAYFENGTSPPRELFSTDSPPACKQGKVLAAADRSPAQNEGYLVTALSQDGQHLLTLMPDTDEIYSSRCLISWNLASGKQSPTIAFSRNTVENLSPADQQTLALTYQSSPLLVLPRKNSIKILADRYGSKVNNYYLSNSGHTIYAQASGSNIELHHRNEDSISGTGGKVTATHVDQTSETLWYASLDGGIRAWKIGSGGRYFDSGLSSVNDLHIGSTYTVATQPHYANRQLKRFSFSVLNTNHQAFKGPYKLEVPQPFDQIDSKLYGNEYLGVLLNYNDGIYLGESKSQRELRLFSLSDGSPITSFQHNEGAYTFPPTNGTYTAYINSHELTLVTLKNGHKQRLTLPEGYHPVDVKFIANELIVSAYDNNRDSPELRHISVFSFNTLQPSKPVKVIEKQAQGLQLQTSSQSNYLLLNWDIYDYQQPSQLMALGANGKVSNITQTWEEKFGVQYLLSEHSDQILVISDREHIRHYDFNGSLLATTYSNQDWHKPRMSQSENYLIDRDSFTPFTNASHCAEFMPNNDVANVADAINGSLLAVASYEAIRLYDLQACTALLDIPYSADNMRIDNNTLWLSKDNYVYRKTIKHDFIENYQTATAISTMQLNKNNR